MLKVLATGTISLLSLLNGCHDTQTEGPRTRQECEDIATEAIEDSTVERKLQECAQEFPCQEDEPCWDCATMGNLICGTTTTTEGA